MKCPSAMHRKEKNLRLGHSIGNNLIAANEISINSMISNPIKSLKR
jgi:hypothetical protein